MKVGQILLEEGRGFKLKVAAKSLDVDVRTLGNWKRQAREATPERKLGRPPHSVAAHRAAMWQVGRELRRQGYPSWRAIEHTLKGKVPTRLIQSYVSQFKRRRAERKAEKIARRRTRVEVLGRDVIWGQDGTHIGRKQDDAVETQVLVDFGSSALVAVPTGPTADHRAVLEQLRKTADTRGGLPLVYARDNGSMYAHADVERYLAEKKVIVLRNLPRTPQHNAVTERKNRELKEAAGLGKGVLIDDMIKAAATIELAASRLNSNRVRPSKGFKTASEMDDMLPVGANCGRDLFYEECRRTMKEAVLGSKTKRQARLAEREAVWVTLEKFGLIKRSRGGESRVRN